MAHIIEKAATCTDTLCRVDFSRQRDCFKLAEMGEKQSARAWNDFARQHEDWARLVILDVMSDAVAEKAANADADAMLVKAEKRAKKARKSRKPKLSKAWKANTLNPFEVEYQLAGMRDQAVMDYRRDVDQDYMRLAMHDPLEREIFMQETWDGKREWPI